MSDRPRFSRKARIQLEASERARLIAEIAAESAGDDTLEAFDLPHVEEASEQDAEELDREFEEIWDPDLDPSDQASLAAEDIFTAAADTIETDQDLPDFDAALLSSLDEGEAEVTVGDATAPDTSSSPAPKSLAAALTALARGLGRSPAAEPENLPRPASEADAGNAPQTDPDGFASGITPAPETEPDTGSIPAPELTEPSEPQPEPVSEAPRESLPEPASPDEVWATLGSIPVDPAHLEHNLIITAGRHDPAHGAFDVLRTRLVQTLYDNDWKRVAVTSPTRDCGKTFTAVNLAISLSRYEAMRTVLMDMDMRNPSVASVLGAPNPGAMGNFLKGASSVQEHFVRLGRNALNIGANLAVGLNNRVEPYAAELIQDPRTDAAFARMMEELDPDVVLYDLPPALAFDDVIAFRKHFDGVLMVIGGGTTTADEVHEAMRRLGEDVPLLGVVLNQAESDVGMGYTYGY